MKKENKKMAQERRAAERKKQENAKIVKNVTLAALCVAIVLGIIIYGVYDTKKNKEAEKQAAQQAQQSNNEQIDNSVTSEPVLDTDPERAVEMGDTVAIHYEGHIGEVYFDGGTGDYDLVIGSHSFIDDFEDQLVGHKIGEQVEVVVNFPENYGRTYIDENGDEQSLNGVEATFDVTINGIY